jgi:pimeloyl-ACP methyl ester carboxylesterase
MSSQSTASAGLVTLGLGLAALLYSFSMTAIADEIHLERSGTSLIGTLEQGDSWPAGATLLVTHGTLSHKDSEIIRTLQALFLEYGVSSLAINLSLGASDRAGPFDCARAHTHRREDAVGELDTWLSWLETQGVTRVIALGHSRGANQTALFTVESGSPLLKAQILIAPPVEVPGAAGEDAAMARQLIRARELVDSGQPQAAMTVPRFLYCDNATVTAASLLSYYGGDPRMDTRVLLREAPVPTLIVTGSEDETTPGLPDAYANLAEQRQVELLVIEGADHFFRDLYADELVESAVEFIDGLPGASAEPSPD